MKDKKLRPIICNPTRSCRCCGKLVRIMVMVEDSNVPAIYYGVAVCPRCDIVRPVDEPVSR